MRLACTLVDKEEMVNEALIIGCAFIDNIGENAIIAVSAIAMMMDFFFFPLIL
jgi:hypothetical protein